MIRLPLASVLAALLIAAFASGRRHDPGEAAVLDALIPRGMEVERMAEGYT